MSDTKISGATVFSGAGAASRATRRAGSTVAYRTVDNLTATVDPAVGNDNTQDYHIGSQWFNTSAGRAWMCTDASTGAAVWKRQMVVDDNLAGLTDAGAALNNLGGIFSGCDPDFSDANVYLTTPNVLSFGTGTLTANRLYVLPAWVTRTRTFTTYACVVTALAASAGTIRVAVANSAGAKLDEGATIDATTATGSTGRKTSAFGASQSLKPGLYFLLMWSDGNPTVVRIPATNASTRGYQFTTSNVNPNPGGYADSVTLVGGVLPGTIPALTQAAAGGQALGVVGIR